MAGPVLSLAGAGVSDILQHRGREKKEMQDLNERFAQSLVVVVVFVVVFLLLLFLLMLLLQLLVM